ncbi:MAG: sigma-70 family RNA polymerase sigma factor [Planctomycetaceae bacterium]
MSSDADNRTDADLVSAINAGDQQAFACLYHRHRDWVVRLAFRLTGHQEDALDVLQETFAYLVRKFPGFVLTAQMTTFLYPAVKNLSIAARRKRQRSLGADCDTGLFAESAADSVSEQTQRDEFSVMLGELSESHREILLMRFVDEMTQPEIAAALDLPLGTVKSRLHHAIQAVKNSPAAAKLQQERSDKD